MKLFNAIAVAILLLSSSELLAQTQSQILKEEQVKVAEVYRRGNHVEHIGVIRGESEQAFLEAISVPADDSNKWFITIISQKNCRPCEALKNDFKTKKELLAFANPIDEKMSWSNYHVYMEDDATQMWRFAALKIESYPTLIVQPPLNGKYGNPSAVVMQKTGYNGKPDELAKQISAQIKRYIATVKPVRSGMYARSQTAKPEPGEALKAGGYQNQREPASAPSKKAYPRYDANEKSGGYQATLWGQDTGRLFPLRPRPDQPTPNPVAPPFTPPPSPNTVQPTVTPAVDPNVIPNPLNPDAVPAPPETPTPAPVPKTPEKPADPVDSETNDKPVVTLVTDGNKFFDHSGNSKLKDLVEKIQRKYPGSSVENVDIATLRRFNPKIDVSDTETPAVVVTKKGTILESVKNILAPDPSDPLPMSSITLLLSGGGITAAIPLVLWLFRRIAKNRSTVDPVTPGVPSPAPNVNPSLLPVLAGAAALALANPQVQAFLMAKLEQLLKPQDPSPAATK